MHCIFALCPERYCLRLYFMYGRWGRKGTTPWLINYLTNQQGGIPSIWPLLGRAQKKQLFDTTHLSLWLKLTGALWGWERTDASLYYSHVISGPDLHYILITAFTSVHTAGDKLACFFLLHAAITYGLYPTRGGLEFPHTTFLKITKQQLISRRMDSYLYS